MAILKHPITGVTLNEMKIRRRALNFIEAVTAHIMHHQGNTYAEIVAMLGTTAFRVGEVFRGEQHPNAAMAALKLLTRSA